MITTTFIDVNGWRTSHKTSRKINLFSIERFRQFSKSYNWNDFVQQTCTICLGIGLGFYAYESNLALLPMKWQMDSKVAKDIKEKTKTKPLPKKTKEDSGGLGIGSFFKKNPVVREFWKQSGVDRYVKNIDKYTKVLDDLGVSGGLKTKVDKLMRDGVEPVPKKWKEKGNLPYVIASLLILILCLVLKICLYFSILDFNRFIKQGKIFRDKKQGKDPVDWNEIIQEFSTILLSVIAGIYTEPSLDLLAGKEASYPYPNLGMGIIIGCVLLKLLPSFKIDFKRSKRKAKTKPKKTAPSKTKKAKPYSKKTTVARKKNNKNKFRR